MKAVRAMWGDLLIAETDEAIMVEGNYYFPLGDIKDGVLTKTSTSTHCPWKGDASYFSLTDGDRIVEDAAWTYQTPTKAASRLKGYVAFWKEVDVIKEKPEEISSRLEGRIASFLEMQSGSSSSSELLPKFQGFLADLDLDGLLTLLPNDFIAEMSFFNFQNSNNLCFHTDSEHMIRRINPTCEWGTEHMEPFVGRKLGSILDDFEVVEGPGLDQFDKSLKSHGWVHVPRLRTTRPDGSVRYYTLDVAITKHGSLDHLSGMQGEMRDITREVELSQSLARSEANTRSLIDGLDEGLFFFDQSGAIAPERSAALSRILPGSESHQDIQSLFCHYSNVRAENVGACLGLLWQQEDDGFFSDFETTVSMLPGSLALNEAGHTRQMTFDYRPIYDEQKNLDKVIVVVHDVTVKLRLEQESRQQEERVRIVTKAASNLQAYHSFAKEMTDLVAKIDPAIDSVQGLAEGPDLGRYLHTLKGSLATFDFHQIAGLLHELEDLVGETSCNINKCADLWTNIKHSFTERIHDISQVLGLERSADLIEVNRKKLEDLGYALRESKQEKIAHQFDGLFRHPPKIVLSKYEDYLARLVERYCDKKVELVFDPSSCDISYEDVEKLDGALIHILRNCFDHGIETEEMRKSVGKDPTGRIKIKTEYRENHLYLEMSDDGGGIDAAKLAQKAIENQFWTQTQRDQASHQDMIHLIFAANLSSKDEISDVSGRGVGMDAVKSLVEGLGGRIEVHSELGKGSSFSILIPLERKMVTAA